MNKLAKNLKRLRLEKGATMKEVAEAVGVHPTTIKHWEEGKGNPVLTKLVYLADFFNVKIDQLVGLKEL